MKIQHLFPTVFLAGITLLPLNLCAQDSNEDQTAQNEQDEQKKPSKMAIALSTCRYLTDKRPDKEADVFVFIQAADDTSSAATMVPSITATRVTLSVQGSKSTMILVTGPNQDAKNMYEATDLPIIDRRTAKRIPGLKLNDKGLTITYLDKDGKEASGLLSSLELSEFGSLVQLADASGIPAAIGEAAAVVNDVAGGITDVAKGFIPGMPEGMPNPADLMPKLGPNNNAGNKENEEGNQQNQGNQNNNRNNWNNRNNNRNNRNNNDSNGQVDTPWGKVNWGNNNNNNKNNKRNNKRNR